MTEPVDPVTGNDAQHCTADNAAAVDTLIGALVHVRGTCSVAGSVILSG